MNETDKLRVLLPHWIEHNGEHAGEFQAWADRAGPARSALLEAARLVEEANAKLRNAMEQLDGPMAHDHQMHHHD